MIFPNEFDTVMAWLSIAGRMKGLAGILAVPNSLATARASYGMPFSAKNLRFFDEMILFKSLRFLLPLSNMLAEFIKSACDSLKAFFNFLGMFFVVTIATTISPSLMYLDFLSFLVGRLALIVSVFFRAEVSTGESALAIFNTGFIASFTAGIKTFERAVLSPISSSSILKISSVSFKPVISNFVLSKIIQSSKAFDKFHRLAD